MSPGSTGDGSGPLPRGGFWQSLCATAWRATMLRKGSRAAVLEKLKIGIQDPSSAPGPRMHSVPFADSDPGARFSWAEEKESEEETIISCLKALLVKPPIFLTFTSLPPDGAGDPAQARTRRQ